MRKITTSEGVELLVPQKGEKHPNAGRPKGSKNVMTRVLKDAILRAAAESKHAKGGGLGRLFEGYRGQRKGIVRPALGEIVAATRERTRANCESNRQAREASGVQRNGCCGIPCGANRAGYSRPPGR
jgi:hypothetical protein